MSCSPPAPALPTVCTPRSWGKGADVGDETVAGDEGLAVGNLFAEEGGLAGELGFHFVEEADGFDAGGELGALADGEGNVVPFGGREDGADGRLGSQAGDGFGERLEIQGGHELLSAAVGRNQTWLRGRCASAPWELD